MNDKSKIILFKMANILNDYYANKKVKCISDIAISHFIMEFEKDNIAKCFNWLKLSIDAGNYEFIEFMTKYQTKDLDKNNKSKNSIFDNLSSISLYIKDSNKQNISFGDLFEDYKKNFNNCVNNKLLEGFNRLKNVSSSLDLTKHL